MPVVNIMFQVVECDDPDCQRHAIPAEASGDAENNADEAGWTHEGDRWYCPKCTKARSGLKPVPSGLTKPQTALLTLLRNARAYYAKWSDIQEALKTTRRTLDVMLEKGFLRRAGGDVEGYNLTPKGLIKLKSVEGTTAS